MKRSVRSLFIILLSLASLGGIAQQNNIEFDSGHFSINGEKVFLKGIGFEVGAIPGQLPWQRSFDEELLRFDMERIEQAGFNAIRTWSAFTEEELSVISDYDIYILMGIWIDPHADFSDPAFIAQAENIVSDVLAYSNQFDHIIGYLIMNEPLPQTIFNAGYSNTVDLWETLQDIIHQQHPGVPVSFANTPNGTFIGQDIFDFTAFNIYVYNPVTVNHSHRYQGFVRYVNDLRDDASALIISEFGLSVSPNGQGGYGYGGNTLSEQLEGNMAMYRALIDGGAGGGFMFNYSDGWWKGGNEWSHDDHPEEWFGLVEYTELSDKYGTPRPIWDEISSYNRAIICKPYNGMICDQMVPLEFFLDDTVFSVSIKRSEDILYTSTIGLSHFVDTLIMNGGMEDVALDFLFYNNADQLLKTESINILLMQESGSTPSIELNCSIDEWNAAETAEVTILLKSNGSAFSFDETLNYASYYHQGFEYGVPYTKTIPTSFEELVVDYDEYITESTPVVTFAAGVGFIYGDYYGYIYDQKQLVYGGYLKVPGYEPEPANTSLALYPNPAKHSFHFMLDEGPEAITYKLYDMSGNSVLQGLVSQGAVGVDHLSPGVYLVKIYDGKEAVLGFSRLIIM